jgi:hypothetical protein
MKLAQSNERFWLLLASLIGPIAWALHFAAVYATQTLLNVQAGSRTALVTATFGYALLACAAMAIVIRKLPRGSLAYLRRLATGLALLSLVAIGWTCLSVAVLDGPP